MADLKINPEEIQGALANFVKSYDPGVAAPLTPAQQERLATTLTSKVGQPVRINIEIDPSVLGGVSVKFADEIVDGSVSNRLAGAARALAGSK